MLQINPDVKYEFSSEYVNEILQPVETYLHGDTFNSELPLYEVDHQEIVETHHSDGDTSSSSWNDRKQFNDQIFSHELETNSTFPLLPENGLLDLPSDFGWLDVLVNTSDPDDLSELQPASLIDPVEVMDSRSSGQQRSTCSENIPLTLINFSPISQPADRTRSVITKCESSEEKEHSSQPAEYDCLDLSEDDDASPLLCTKRKFAGDERPKAFLNNEDLVNGKPGQRLSLSPEERKLLQSMNIRLPAYFPLSRTEEKALRSVRRKIRNKLSAQASRVRRQGYVVDLEHRVMLSNEENGHLRQQVKQLKKDKQELVDHVRKLRSYMAKLINRNDQSTLLPLFVESVPSKSTKSAAQAATAAGGTSIFVLIFIILAWTARVPTSSNRLSMRNPYHPIIQPVNPYQIFPGRSRTLKQANSVLTDQELHTKHSRSAAWLNSASSTSSSPSDHPNVKSSKVSEQSVGLPKLDPMFVIEDSEDTSLVQLNRTEHLDSMTSGQRTLTADS